MKTKQKNPRLAAFTIAELIIVMALSLLVVAIAMSAYRIINAQYLNYERESRVVLDLSTLKSLLYKDIFRAKTLHLAERNIRLQFDGFELYYTFASEAIIRKPSLAGTLPDTFWVAPQRWEASFEKKLVELGLIDYLELEIEWQEQKEKLIFQKSYSASQLLRLPPQ